MGADVRANNPPVLLALLLLIGIALRQFHRHILWLMKAQYLFN